MRTPDGLPWLLLLMLLLLELLLPLLALELLPCLLSERSSWFTRRRDDAGRPLDDPLSSSAEPERRDGPRCGKLSSSFEFDRLKRSGRL